MANPIKDADKGDPFFWLPADSQWNACIGKQGEEENYIDGYIEAALELARAILSKKMYGKRDTLVMPILYNARHALELVFKYAAAQLVALKVISTGYKKDHDILSLWRSLNESCLGDEILTDCVAAFEPYILSLATVDEDGQKLRYFKDRSGKRNIDDRSLANIGVIFQSLEELKKLVDRLMDRLFDLATERNTGSYTELCSRRDLLEIAKLLPDRGDWDTDKFHTAKIAIEHRFKLNEQQFSAALAVIEANREMRTRIGLASKLTYLTDEKAILVVRQWCRLHPSSPNRNEIEIGGPVKFDFEEIDRSRRVAIDVNNTILENLTPDEIADLETIFDIGRNRDFCEYYERKLKSAKANASSQASQRASVSRLMNKTNFSISLARGAATLGRPDLAKRLTELREQ